MSIAEGGFLLIALGAVVGYLSRGLSRVFTYAKSKCVYVVTCNNDNWMYWYFEAWVDQGEYIKTCKNIALKHQNDRYIKTLGYGLHTFKHNGVRLFVYKNKEESKDSYHIREVITAIAWTRSMPWIDGWFDEIKESWEKQPYKHTKVTINKMDIAIEKPIVNREPSLADDIYQDLCKDLGSFLAKENEYNKRGIPYKRGYLFFGPPGNGKTTTILCLAQKFKKHLRFLNLSQMSNDDLIYAVANLGKDTIVVLEDFDSIKETHQREEVKKPEEKGLVVNPQQPTGITLNVMLNCLDGLLTKHGMITIATTNHVEKLDSALIRPGRMDKRVEFKNSSKEQAEAYYKKFFPDEDPSEFVAEFTGKPMCALEEYVLKKLNETESL